MDTGNVRIKLDDKPGPGTVIEIDGQDMAGLCTGLTFDLSLEAAPRLELTLLALTCDIDAHGVQINGVPTDDGRAAVVYKLLQEYFEAKGGTG